MRVHRRIATSLALTLVMTVAASLASGGPVPVLANGVAFQPSDVFAAVISGQVLHYSSQGALRDTLNTGTSSNYMTGMCFDAAGNLRTTDFNANVVSKFDNHGSLQAWASGFNADPESCVVDAAGNIYIGEADGTGVISKFDPSGTRLATYPVARQDRGSDWIDLAADQCTMYYTSEGDTIKRFDVCQNKQLADFATVPGVGQCYALRIRPSADVMVACTSEVVRLSATGTVLQTYSAAKYGDTYLFAMNLDPDGASFWTADYNTGKIDKISIADGTDRTTIKAGQGVYGLTVLGEITVANQVKDYRQDSTDPDDGGGPWALRTQLMANQCLDTIAGFGCALTSVADVMFSYGVQTIPRTQTTLDPGSLNELLKEHGWSGCAMSWWLPGSLLHHPDISTKFTGPFPDRVRQALALGDLTIVHLSDPRNSKFSHYVVVYQSVGSDFLIADPAEYVVEHSGQPLGTDYPGDVIDEVHVFDRGPHAAGGWNLIVHSPVQLLVTDPNDLRTGYVASSGTIVQEIPGSAYYVSKGVSDDTGVSPPAPDTPFFEIGGPWPGTYTVQVIGTGVGPYRLDFAGTDDNGQLTTSTFSGTASPGSIDTFHIVYTRTSGVTMAASPSLSATALPSPPMTGTGGGSAGLIRHTGLVAGLLVVLGVLLIAGAGGVVRSRHA